MIFFKLKRLLLVTGLALGLSACADFNWRQSLYDLGDNRACQQTQETISGSAGAVVACADPGHPEWTRYEDYKNKRDAANEGSTS